MNTLSIFRPIQFIVLIFAFTILFFVPSFSTAATVNITLLLQESPWEIRPNLVLQELYLFSQDGRPPTLPGPEIRVNEGDYVEVTITNTMSHSHTLIFPGLGGTGMGELELPPGGSNVFSFLGSTPGTYYYAGKTPQERDRGMYGAIVVHSPNERPIPPQLDYVRFFDEIPRDWKDSIDTVHGDPDHVKPTYHTHEFILNGKTIDSKVRGNNIEGIKLFADIGETLVIRTISIGSETHAPHVHSHLFDTTENGLTTKDGEPALTTPTDVVRMPSLAVKNLYITARSLGPWPLHCHVETHLLNNEDADYPGGMFTFLDVGSVGQSRGGDSNQDD